MQENEHLAIERFIGRALTIEEIGSIKPEAFPVVGGTKNQLILVINFVISRILTAYNTDW